MTFFKFFGSTTEVVPSRSEDSVKLHITDTGRIWVDPNEVVKTEAFKKQREAVRRLREAKERASQESAAV